MIITGIEQMLIGAWALQTLSAAVSAMGKPKKDYGAYLYLYKFAHSITNNLDSWFEQKFNVVMPRVTDETAITQPTETLPATVNTTVNP